MAALSLCALPFNVDILLCFIFRGILLFVVVVVLEFNEFDSMVDDEVAAAVAGWKSNLLRMGERPGVGSVICCPDSGMMPSSVAQSLRESIVFIFVGLCYWYVTRAVTGVMDDFVDKKWKLYFITGRTKGRNNLNSDLPKWKNDFSRTLDLSLTITSIVLPPPFSRRKYSNARDRWYCIRIIHHWRFV